MTMPTPGRFHARLQAPGQEPRFVSVRGTPELVETIEDAGQTFRRTRARTAGGWPVYVAGGARG